MSQVGLLNDPVADHDCSLTRRLVNSTFIVSLSTSWEPSKLVMTEVRKPAPVLSEEMLFVDHASRTFIAWGGHSPYHNRSVDDVPWRFTTTASGNGAWVPDSPANPNSYFVRRVDRAAAASGVFDEHAALFQCSSDGFVGFEHLHALVIRHE